MGRLKQLVNNHTNKGLLEVIRRTGMKPWGKRRNAARLTYLRELLSPLPEGFRTALLSMYSGEHQIGSDGGLYALDLNTRIPPERGMWLYQTCCALKPMQTLEIGLGYGFSTIFFLAAIHNNGSGIHTAIDPFQNDLWHGIGVTQSEKFAMTNAFRFVNEKSVAALTDLARANRRFELIFIDGNHRFDDVLVDFTLSAELCPVGGYIVVDDLWMPSIKRAASFIRENRTDFKEVASPIATIAAFERLREDGRHWDHYAEF